MPENNIGLATQVWEIIRYPFAMLLTLVMWIMGRQVRRIDDLEKTTVTTDTLNSTINRLDDSIKGIHKRLDKIYDRGK